MDKDFDDLTIEIDHERCYTKYSEIFFFHNLDKESSIKVISDLDIGAWILWHYKQDGKERNAITIKLKEGYAHHYNFILDVFNKEHQVLNIVELYSKLDPDILDDRMSCLRTKNIGHFMEKEKKTYVHETYKTFFDFLKKLNNIYGLEIDKQVIYEND
jgi:hypothetical protein